MTTNIMKHYEVIRKKSIIDNKWMYFCTDIKIVKYFYKQLLSIIDRKEQPLSEHHL